MCLMAIHSSIVSGKRVFGLSYLGNMAVTYTMYMLCQEANRLKASTQTFMKTQLGVHSQKSASVGSPGS